MAMVIKISLAQGKILKNSHSSTTSRRGNCITSYKEEQTPEFEPKATTIIKQLPISTQTPPVNTTLSSTTASKGCLKGVCFSFEGSSAVSGTEKSQTINS